MQQPGPQHLLLLSGKESRRTQTAIRHSSKCVLWFLLLGFTPGRWRGDIMPSGSHCSGLTVTADVWLRSEVRNDRLSVGRV